MPAVIDVNVVIIIIAHLAYRRRIGCRGGVHKERTRNGTCDHAFAHERERDGAMPRRVVDRAPAVDARRGAVFDAIDVAKLVRREADRVA